MKYAHLADLHLGSWREEKMRELSTKSFLRAIEFCLQHQVDFILFAGDIFNTSLPSIDTLKVVTKTLRELKEKSIPLYIIPGSHDFSPSGKTMLDVLEHAGLLANVCKGSVNAETQQLYLHFTIDAKTGAKITGILGRKGQLDRIYYEHLALEHLEQEPGYRIFMFHTSVDELKPADLQQVESYPASFLPKGFNYYAGGHLHYKNQVTLPGYGTLTYPGALFPNNFAEIEKYSHGGFYLVTVENQQKTVQQAVAWIPVKVIEHCHFALDCSHKSPEAVALAIKEYFEAISIQDTLVTIRLSGKLEKGKAADLNFKEIVKSLYAQGAYFVSKNTAALTSEEFAEIKIAEANPALVEEQLIKEHLQQNTLFDCDTELYLTKTLLTALNTSKREGETVADFQQRIEQELSKVLQVSL